MTALPRVLLMTSESPHSGAAGAIVLLRLFRDFPPDRLVVVTSAPPPQGSERLAVRYETLGLAVDRLNRTRLWTWRTMIRIWGGARLLRLSRIDRALRGFKPDVVATLMQDSWYYDFAARYARQRRLPLALFIHDLPGGFEPVPPALRKRQQKRDAAVFRQAAARFCISSGMADWFSDNTGQKAEVLPPPASDLTPTRDPAMAARLRTPGTLTLGCAGGLHYGYGEQLLAMLPALRSTGTRLELWTPMPAGRVAPLADATDVIRFHPRLPTPEEAWRNLIDRCDAVLLPYLNPPGEHERQYRTHFPSKLGDCLRLGIPLVITGPTQAAGVAWCLRHPGSAWVIADPSLPALEAALVRLRDDAALRVSLANRGRGYSSEFSACRVRETLNRRLQEIAR